MFFDCQVCWAKEKGGQREQEEEGSIREGGKEIGNNGRGEKGRERE